MLKKLIYYFWQYNKKYGSYYYAYLVSLIIGTIVSGIILPLFLRQFIDQIAKAQQTNEIIINSLYSLLIYIAICSVVHLIARFTADYFILLVDPEVVREIEMDCFSKIHQLPYGFFAETRVGSLVAKVKRFSTGYLLLDLHLTRGLFESLILLSSTVIVVCFISKLLAIIFIVWGILYFGLILSAVNWKMRLDLEKVRADSLATGILADSVTNFLAVKIFSLEKTELSNFSKVSEEVVKKTKISWYSSTIINAFQSLLVGCISVLILFLAVRLWEKNLISVGTIVLLQTYVFILGNSFLQLAEQLKAIYRAAADCVEMMEIIEQPLLVLDPLLPAKPLISKGSIFLDAVDFSYKAENPLFRGLTLKIPTGQRVGLVGRSGAGKSTFMALLLRFMDVQGGSIKIDEQDIRLITQVDLRQHLSYVPQDTLLFHLTIKENISCAKPTASEEEIIEAAQHAHAHEFIIKLPQGYDTVVGERGIKLSGGERQRISIARAMLKDAPILLLDEATSSLDSLSEMLIRQSFDKLVENRTTIVIAHRLSTVQKLDRILFLREGEIIEEGSHQELLEKNGFYAELWQYQSNGFIGK